MKLPRLSASLLLAASLHPNTALSTNANTTNTTSESPTYPLSPSPFFDLQFIIALQDALSGGADIAPVLGAAKNTIPHSFESFSDHFYKLANETKAAALDPDNAYDAINVRDTWFAASQYFRRADDYIHSNWSDPRIDELWREQADAFDRGIAALDCPGERVKIPASVSGSNETFDVEAIWFGAPGSRFQDQDKKRPTLIVGNGFDAWQEDSYHIFVAPALARGYNAITYEGPGQTTVRRNQDIGFIHTWEDVVTPVVDYIYSEKLDVVDESRLVLLGNSFGGYLAARAAAFEKRIKAAVLIGGVWDVYEAFKTQLPDELLAIYEAGNFSQFDETVLSLREENRLPVESAWGIDQGLWAFYTRSLADFFTRTKQYNLEDLAHLIDIPVFVGDAEFETIFKGQPKKVQEAIGDKATLHVFNGTAGYHCQSGAGMELARTIFGWLNRTLW
ncbi:alpha/beta hydrolase [Aspergillus stella-maris]|uniref:alpha/beta hydrolase n=1 Tax=Aspergillus stella-maris TaxID=1810926 RepID=UPI003CCD2B67